MYLLATPNEGKSNVIRKIVHVQTLLFKTLLNPLDIGNVNENYAVYIS